MVLTPFVVGGGVAHESIGANTACFQNEGEGVGDLDVGRRGDTAQDASD
jgi:hypothetical protein